MLAKIYSSAVFGLEGRIIEVEVDLVKRGFPSFKIVGLPSAAVKEAKERVQSAILNSNSDFPDYRLTVNLAPADFPKEGSAYDLPIALGILIASGQTSISPELEESIVLGELSLDGELRSVPGVLAQAMWAQEEGFKRVFLPQRNAKEASVIKELEVMPVSSLSELVYHFNQLRSIKPHPYTNISQLVVEGCQVEFDMEEVKGQEQAKRALEIAAAGGHNLFMLGPPGAGKTMLARALPGILPRLTAREALEVTKVYSISGRLPLGEALVTVRPFQAPHHTISRVGLVGGGSKPQPGEVSLAHRGVLFLDEFTEFPRHVLESLRQPMEDGRVTISRAFGALTFPCRFLMVAASNPCPCGFRGSKKKKCACTPAQVYRYRRRISGPIMDRIDLYVEVPEVEPDKLMPKDKLKLAKSKTSREVQEKVQEARDRQNLRYKNLQVTCNSELAPRQIKRFCEVGEESEKLLRQALSQAKLSARGYHRVLKVARTIADLDRKEEIESSHVAEALQFRKRSYLDLA